MAEMADLALPARETAAVKTREAMARRIIDRLFLCGAGGVSSGFFQKADAFFKEKGGPHIGAALSLTIATLFFRESG
jgi:hypothetical protein